MRVILTLWLLATPFWSRTEPAQQRGSDPIKSSVEEKVRPYFQNVKVVLQPTQHEILALTCMQGAGPSLVKMAGENFGQQLQQPGIDSLIAHLYLAIKGYRYVGLGFDTALVLVDLRTKSVSYKQANSLVTYGELYRQSCSQGPS